MKTPDIHVISATELEFGGKRYRCAIGRGGFVNPDEKREGDLKTPTGSYALRELWYRPDRLAKPVCALPTRAIDPQDGWCDDPAEPSYNVHVKLPFTASHEKLWREDGVYDLIVPLGYNDAPPVAGRGSAIFMHIARPDWRGTEGCVALAKDDLLKILGQAGVDTHINIAPQ